LGVLDILPENRVHLGWRIKQHVVEPHICKAENWALWSFVDSLKVLGLSVLGF